jgi:hypothetical protein
MVDCRFGSCTKNNALSGVWWLYLNNSRSHMWLPVAAWDFVSVMHVLQVWALFGFMGSGHGSSCSRLHALGGMCAPPSPSVSQLVCVCYGANFTLFGDVCPSRSCREAHTRFPYPGWGLTPIDRLSMRLTLARFRIRRTYNARVGETVQESLFFPSSRI